MFFSGSKVFVPLEQWFSTGGDFVPGGHVAEPGDFMVVITVCVCVCVRVCIYTHVWVLLASGILWVEARDAAKLPAVPEAAPYRRELCRDSVSGAEAEKPCFIKLSIKSPNDCCRPLHYVLTVWKTLEKVPRGESCINTSGTHHSLLACQIQMSLAGVQTWAATFYG